MGFVRWLFGTGDFMAHGYCYMWNPALLRLHWFSDLSIGLAYVAISLTLLYLVRKGRHNIPFHWIFLAFGLFIIACGATHFMEVWTLWTPVYWLSGAVKALTAIASVATAIVLPPLVPRALDLVRSSKVSEEQNRQMTRMNLALREEVAERIRAESEIRQLNDQLEARVSERTAELEQANAQLAEKANIVQHSRDAIFSHTQDGSVTSWNHAAEQVYGYTAEEMIGKSAALLVPPEHMEEFSTIMGRLQSGEAFTSFETLRHRKDGSVVHVSTTISPITDGAGLLRGASVIARDVTEQRRSEAQLREMQKLESLGVIAGGVAHDFNNLLVGILGNASLALQDLTEPGETRESIEQVIAAGEKAASLTQQLLAYAGKGRFIVEPQDVSQVVRDISSLIRTSIPKRAELQLDLADDLPPVNADPGQLQQVIMNLVINGAEAISEDRDGTVFVSTGLQVLDAAYIRMNYGGEALEPGTYVTLEVQDNGVGMDAVTKSKIFDPFFTTKFTGRGLGLSAVIGVIRGHKGMIRVYSEPGKGTIMKVLLPAAPHQSVERKSRRVDADLQGSGTILIVDDEEVVRNTAKAALERFGYTVMLADNGRSGVDAFRNHADQIDAVLLDMTMPIMGGEEAFRQMRIIRPDARVILSSGYNEAEAVRRFSAGGSSAFIQKPYAATKLARLVKSVITHDGKSAEA